jgi:hypothetical protein
MIALALFFLCVHWTAAQSFSWEGVPLVHLASVAHLRSQNHAISFRSLSSRSTTAVFVLEFDNTPYGNVTPPLVGSGTVSFDGPAVPGTYPLLNLTNFVFAATVDGHSFGNADIQTRPLANVTVQISQDGPNLLLSFGGLVRGPFGGKFFFCSVSNMFAEN